MSTPDFPPLHAEIAGPPDAPAVVFLHGFMGSSADWAPIVARLGERVRTILVDLPDHGASLWPGTYGFDETVQALDEVLDRYGVGTATIVGYSMGGRIALYWALSRPERITRLVLESGSPGLPNDVERAERRRDDEIWAQSFEENPLESVLHRWYERPLFASLANRVDLVDPLFARRLQNDAHALARSLRCLGTGAQPSLWKRLSEVRVPVHMITGERDTKFCALAGRMATFLPWAIRVQVPGCGHNVHLEAPDIYAKFLRQALSIAEPDR